VKRKGKYIQYRKLLKLALEEKAASKSIKNRYYYRRNGFYIWIIPNKKARKHLLYNALKQVIPLVFMYPIRLDKEEYISFQSIYESDHLLTLSRTIDKSVYLKLSTEQKMCFIRTNVSLLDFPMSEEFVKDMKGPRYILDSSINDLLTIKIRKRYVKEWNPFSNDYSDIYNKINRLGLRKKVDRLMGNQYDYYLDSEYKRRILDQTRRYEDDQDIKEFL
jgi:hypothetical protein